ncbi:unnamed protein product [Adineta steineri]|uniref:Uncharacterized protein n=1 Tax=Adineta steineri TaxID=433720 RepID=A0A815KN39_9BILA|nr:unnamed protein product [Adineta steineri]CAF1611830.1 unnamed protein product [Adineta steineri]
MSLGGFSSSGCVSNQGKEGIEDIQGNEYSTGGNHSFGMSSSGSINNQAHLNCKNKDDIGEHKTISNNLPRSIPFKN